MIGPHDSNSFSIGLQTDVCGLTEISRTQHDSFPRQSDVLSQYVPGSPSFTPLVQWPYWQTYPSQQVPSIFKARWFNQLLYMRAFREISTTFATNLKINQISSQPTNYPLSRTNLRPILLLWRTSLLVILDTVI